MANYSTPTFRLFGGQLGAQDLNVPEQNDGRATHRTNVTAAEQLLRSVYVSALRWTHEVPFGFARTPFQLWRRTKTSLRKTQIQTFQIDGSRELRLNLGDIYRFQIRVRNQAGQSLRIQPFGRDGRLIPGKTEVVTDADRTITITQPFMRGLQLTGVGEVYNCMVLVQHELINNKKGWELVQETSFPFKQHTLDPAKYDTRSLAYNTGFITPEQAATLRLHLGSLCHGKLPPLPGGLPTPEWLPPVPDIPEYLDYLRDPQSGVMDMIRKCLESTEDRAADPARRQPQFFIDHVVNGLRQEGFNGTIEDSTATIPVVGATVLAALVEKFVGLALGYATYDFYPRNDNAVPIYMVTNTFVTRPNRRDFLPDIAQKVNFAALVEWIDRPADPVIENIRSLHQNRPLVRDSLSTEAVELRFRTPKTPMSYGIIAKVGSAAPTVLNEPYPRKADSYEPIVLNQPAPENATVEPMTYVIPNSKIPANGTLDHRFFAIGMDVLGRWTGYGNRNYRSEALPTQRPGLTDVQLTHVTPLVNGLSSEVACELMIEFTWDWAERTPGIFQFGGGFFPFDKKDVPKFITQFSLRSGNPPRPALQPFVSVTFNNSGVPMLSGAPGSVVEVRQEPDANIDPNLRKYRMTLTGITSVFPGPVDAPPAPPAVAPSRVAYAVYLRAMERLRMPDTPKVWSPWSGPLTSRLDDPRPPVMVNLPADVNWTALPDAGHIARGTLSWPAISRATGYMVWQANETALREALGLNHRPGDSLVDRATELRDHLANANNDMRSLKAFIRLNRDPIPVTSTQLELPGSAEVLYVYRISATTVANVESERSNVVFFAVPRQQIPGPPRLRLALHQNGSTGVQVMALPGAGPVPAGYRVYRVRKAIGPNVVQMKGLPILKENHTDWADYSLRSLSGQVDDGKQIIDPVGPPSWKPYYYQLVAVGADAPAQGLLKGVSSGSNTEVIHHPPALAPTITLNQVRHSPTNMYVQFETDAPLVEHGLGNTRIEVYGLVADAPGGPPKRKLLLGADAGAMERTERRIRPNFPPLPVPFDAVEAHVNDNTGRLFLRIDPVHTTIILKVIDPLGRSTEQFIEA